MVERCEKMEIGRTRLKVKVLLDIMKVGMQVEIE